MANRSNRRRNTLGRSAGAKPEEAMRSRRAHSPSWPDLACDEVRQRPDIREQSYLVAGKRSASEVGWGPYTVLGHRARIAGPRVRQCDVRERAQIEDYNDLAELNRHACCSIHGHATKTGDAPRSRIRLDHRGGRKSTEANRVVMVASCLIHAIKWRAEMTTRPVMQTSSLLLVRRLIIFALSGLLIFYHSLTLY
jgi:hypothetical protein